MLRIIQALINRGWRLVEIDLRDRHHQKLESSDFTRSIEEEILHLLESRNPLISLKIRDQYIIDSATMAPPRNLKEAGGQNIRILDSGKVVFASELTSHKSKIASEVNLAIEQAWGFGI